MSRGKSKVKIMLDSSQAALFAGIEIHNKPLIPYRYQTATILIIAAWELALKAFVYKYLGKSKIYEKDKKHTITFSHALVQTKIRINAEKKNSEFEAVAKNLFLLEDYRNDFVHFGNENLDTIVFMLISKAVENYNKFVKEYFSKDITEQDNLIILPIGLKLPVDPVEYLRKRAVPTPNDDFVKSVINSIQELKNNGVSNTVVIGFDFHMASAKKVQNADIVAAIDAANAEIQVANVKQVRITDDPNAPAVQLQDPILPPLLYADVQQKLKEIFPEIKFNASFHQVMKEIKNDKSLCETRYLNPKDHKSSQQVFYWESAIPIIIEKYKQRNGIV